MTEWIFEWINNELDKIKAYLGSHRNSSRDHTVYGGHPDRRIPAHTAYSCPGTRWNYTQRTWTLDISTHTRLYISVINYHLAFHIKWNRQVKTDRLGTNRSCSLLRIAFIVLLLKYARVLKHVIISHLGTMQICRKSALAYVWTFTGVTESQFMNNCMLGMFCT